MKIGIVNYSIGNVGSVYSAFKFYNYNVSLIDTPGAVDAVDMLVLAGVGNYPAAAFRLKSMSLWERIDEAVTIRKKPILGICLGMQLFADIGYENGKNKGFGWIAGEVIKMEGNNLRVPHIGWDEVSPQEDTVFKSSRYNFFYFMHSYHFMPKDKSAVIASTNYGDLEICAAVKKDNIVGVQFHPEKSQGDGLRFIKNTVEELL